MIAKNLLVADWWKTVVRNNVQQCILLILHLDFWWRSPLQLGSHHKTHKFCHIFTWHGCQWFSADQLMLRVPQLDILPILGLRGFATGIGGTIFPPHSVGPSALTGITHNRFRRLPTLTPHLFRPFRASSLVWLWYVSPDFASNSHVFVFFVFVHHWPFTTQSPSCKIV